MAKEWKWKSGVGTIDFSQIGEFGEKLEKLAGEQRVAFFQECARELAAQILGMAIDGTRVKTGELKKGWTGGQEISPDGFVRSLGVDKEGDNYIVTIGNNVKHAIYKEFGHVTRDRKGWVEGDFMLTIAMQDADAKGLGFLEKKLNDWLNGVFT